jgi:hypothetical protein
VEWRPATALSGFAEATLALIAIMYWYSYTITTWVDRGWDAALSGKMPVGVTDHQIGFTALLIFATHPLTWAIAYFGVEGSVRLLGAIASGNNLGILPLFVADKVFGKITGRADAKTGVTMESSRGNVSSYLGAVGDSVMGKFLPSVPDELSLIRNETEEILEIRASRKKADWIPPRVVRYQDAYYRLEADTRGIAPRPFHYQLRRLERGVPGRNVLLYSPEQPLIRTKI